MSGQFNIGAITPARYFFGIAFLLGLLFALISPASAQDWDGVRRMFQWQAQTLTPMALLIASHLLLHQWEWFDRLNPWLKLIFSGIFGAMLFSPFALLLDVWLHDEVIAKGQWPAALMEEFSHLASPVIICWVAVNAPWLLGFRLEKHLNSYMPDEASWPAPSQDNDKKQHHKEPPFFQLVPSDIRSDIVYLKAELHYLEVVTIKGKALILYNLKDAMHELSERSGFQTHRSYWVARQFVQALKKDGRQGRLQLTNGELIPVSRRNMEEVATLVAQGAG